MALKDGWNLLKAAGAEFSEDNAMSLSAALAFYAALSLAPLLMLLVAVAALAGESMRNDIITRIQSMVGTQAKETVASILQQAAKRRNTGVITAIFGFATLLFSATGVFAQLQYSLNTIWNVESKPGQGLWGWMRKRILSFGMLLGIGFLLLVSMALTAAISFLFSGLGSGWFWQAVNFVASFVVYTLLFAMIFKFLPDVKITWRDVGVGAVFTAILFTIGKFAIGKYLGYSSVGSAYGAAGSLVVLLLWVYYASLILFFGAELTQLYASKFGSRIEPEQHAQWADDRK